MLGCQQCVAPPCDANFTDRRLADLPADARDLAAERGQRNQIIANGGRREERGVIPVERIEAGAGANGSRLAICCSVSVTRCSVREASQHGDQRRRDPALLRNQDVVGASRGSCRHRLKSDAGFGEGRVNLGAAARLG